MERHDKPVRVAIYTRKSVEDAEDKAFNSIDAQRQMCESFIAAKAAEGWVALPDRYDDYGYSGGDLDRPAYQRLMADCEQGKIDKIVVFRIDRMTRSTKDFCEFDEKMKKLGIGFTSVSEPFVDTSSPMGELVVNLIVSFGQWERKMIQERIQRHFRTALDQGYFVGGIPPYGYKVENQNLIPDPATAKNVPHIFKLFLQHRSAKMVAAQLQSEGIERFPGRPWTIQSIHNCLRNVRYVGDANSHGKIVKGRQQPLITRDLWDKVNGLLKVSANRPAKRASCPETAIFQGLVFCGHCKRPMSYRWSKKNTLGVRKYSYFVYQQDMRKGVSTCPIRHVSVTTVQDAVEQELEAVMLASTAMLVAAAKPTRQQLNTTMAQGTDLKSFAKATAWMKMIDEGKVASISQLAELVGIDRHFVLHTLRLATLSPRIVRAALSGDLPDGFSLQKVRKIETDDWEEQERILGFPPAT